MGEVGGATGYTGAVLIPDEFSLLESVGRACGLGVFPPEVGGMRGGGPRPG